MTVSSPEQMKLETDTTSDLSLTPSSVSDNLRPWQRLIASSCGGILTSVLTTPFDVIKIRLQAQAKPLHHGECYIFSSGLTDHLCVHCGSKPPLCRSGVNGHVYFKNSWVGSQSHHNFQTMCFPSGRLPQCLFLEASQTTTKKLYEGSVDAAIKIVRREGLPALWTGLPPTLVIALPGTVIYYTLYDVIKAWLGFDLHATGDKAKAQSWIPPVTGAASRMAAVMILSPLELARTKVQSETLTYTSIIKSMRESVANNGLRSLWLGAGPTLLRDVPFSALYWLVFDSGKSQLLRRKLNARATGGVVNEKDWVAGLPRLSFQESFLLGAFAGCVSAIITLPFDVIKTHRQIELGQAIFSKRKNIPPSTWSSIRELYKARGPRVLFTGITPRLVKIMPACAIMISSFEYMKTYFAHANTRPV